MSALASYRNRNNAATGQAAETAFAFELERRGGTVWRVNAGTNARFNKDIFGFDLLCFTGTDCLFVQVKATATEPRMEPIWMARFLALPKPPGCRFLLAWLRPGSDGWCVWRLLADGTRLAMDWPPIDERNV